MKARNYEPRTKLRGKSKSYRDYLREEARKDPKNYAYFLKKSNNHGRE